MPISGNGKLYYTREQYEYAQYQCSALEYARSQGYELEKVGSYYRWKEHDSFTFRPDGAMWFWNSRDMKGGAIEFLTHIEHKPLVEAILILNGERELERGLAERKEMPVEEKTPFVLPEKNVDNRRVYAYLCSTRHLDSQLVSALMKQGKIYESKEHHNAAFVFTGKDNLPVGAFMRSTNTMAENQFKGMAKGSDKRNGYFVFGGNPKASVACIFEACIDAMSYANLQMRVGNNDLTQRYYVASGGTGDANVLGFLKDHPSVNTVFLCFDNDAAGKKMSEGLLEKLQVMEYQVSSIVPEGKDFNDDLRREVADDLEQGEVQE